MGVDINDWYINAGQNYCRMLQGEHSAMFSTFISYQLSLRPLFCLFLDWPFYLGFTVCLQGLTKYRL